MMKKKLLIVVLLSVCSQLAFSQANEVITDSSKMEWFEEAKLGIFIHWGIYAVNGIDESWSFFNNYISHEDYMKQLSGFNAKKYDPEFWVGLIKESGAKYAVITTKHHDGVALWDTKQSDLNVVDQTPAKRDLIDPFVKELRKEDIKVGLYYSLLDWSHEDYPNLTRIQKRYEDDKKRWDRFVRFNHAQIKEITNMFEPDLYWFDGDWEQPAEKWQSEKIRNSILEFNKKAIINSRLNEYGDYATPEQGLPIIKPKDKYWELCMTMNDSWGFQHNDKNYKSSNQIIRIFVDCLNMGGNLLLDIGPKADGSIPDEQIKIMEDLGRWVRKHDKAVYQTQSGISKDYFYGPTTLSKDSTILYLYLDNKPNGPIALKGIKNKINRIWVVGNGTKLDWDIKMKSYWNTKPGIIYIDVPEEVMDEQVTVIAVLLDGPVDLYKKQ